MPPLPSIRSLPPIAASRFYPQAVISNITGLLVHNLSDEPVERIDVDIERSRSIAAGGVEE